MSQENITIKKTDFDMVLKAAIVAAGATVGIIVVPVNLIEYEKSLAPLYQAINNEEYQQKTHLILRDNIETFDWINLIDNAVIKSENLHLTKLGSYKNKSLKGEKLSLIINSSYNISPDYDKLEFNAHVTLNKINYRPNKTNLNQVLYQNSYRYISSQKQFTPRTKKENQHAANAIESWYQLEYSKLGSRMTSKRKEKLAALKKLKSYRLSSEVGELSQKARQVKLVEFWAHDNAIEVNNFINRATKEISKMILLDMQDSRTFEQLKADPQLKSLTGGAKLISSDEQRILVRTFGVATEGRLCSLPKSLKLKNCLG